MQVRGSCRELHDVSHQESVESWQAVGVNSALVPADLPVLYREGPHPENAHGPSDGELETVRSPIRVTRDEKGDGD